MITWARNNGIMVGPARGSSAGSLVCWLMGITQIDPLRWGLYFERFLDIEREDYPDIDVDFQDDQRHRVFEYVRAKYGYDKTSQITTFGFLKPKSAFRDVCRVNDKDMASVNFLSKKVEDVNSFDEDPELAAFSKKNPLIVETAKALCGTIRSQGCHAAGVVVSSRPLTDVCVVEKRSGSDVCNWDKRECEKFGLIKIDALGLSTLSVLARAKELIAKTKGVDVVFEDIEFDDENVLQLFKDGNTIGIFQFESANMRNLLKSIAPKNFRAVTDCTALYRPGSLGSGQTDKYVSIARGDEYEAYAFSELKPILQDTHGVLCLHKDTLVSMADGSEKTIEMVKIGDMVMSVNEVDKITEPKECHGCAPTRFCDGLKITLNNGYSVVVTEDHKVLTWNGMKMAKDLDLNSDIIAVPTKITHGGTFDKLAPWLGIDTDVSYLLGQLTGDGHVKTGVILCVGDESSANTIACWINERFPALKTSPYHHTRSWYIGISSNLL